MSDDESQDERSQLLSILDRTTNLSESADNNGVDEKADTVTPYKCFIILVLVFGAVVGSSFVWEYASNQERLSFRTAFEDQASRLMAKFILAIETRVAVASSLSVSFTSSMKNQPWPNVTMPDFQEQSQIPLHPAFIGWIAFAPIVQADQRDGWEAYVIETEKSKQGYSELHTGQSIKGADGHKNFATEYRNRTLQDGIWCRDVASGRAVDDSTGGPYAPVWQVSQRLNRNELVLFNMFDGAVRQRAMDMMIHTGAVTLSEMLLESEHDNHPKSFFFVPVLEDFTSESVVGAIVLEVDWLMTFQELLSPRNQQGEVSIVIENTCGQAHTLEINGVGDVQHVGVGDRHDTAFDYLSRKSGREDLRYLAGAVPFARTQFDSIGTNGRLRYPKRFALNNATSQCEYEATIHPTYDFESRYLTSKSIYCTIFVGAIFLFIIRSFLVYDFVIQLHRKNARVVDNDAGAISNVTIPPIVQNRVDENAIQNEKSSQISQTDEDNNSLDRRLKRMLPTTRIPMKIDKEAGEPIANLYPSTTVVSNHPGCDLSLRIQSIS